MKSVRFQQESPSVFTRADVRFAQESLSAFGRNRCPFSAGIAVRFAQE